MLPWQVFTEWDDPRGEGACTPQCPHRQHMQIFSFMQTWASDWGLALPIQSDGAAAPPWRPWGYTLFVAPAVQ